MRAKTLFFDIGNVLVFFSHQKMMERLALIFETSFESILKFILEEKIQDNYELGYLSTQELYFLFCTHFEKKPPLSELKTALNYAFLPNNEILPIIERLRENGHQLILLSNTCDAHFNYLIENYPFLRTFDDKILSHKVFLKKPDPRIYELALSKAKYPSLFIDDLEENVLAANNSGLKASLYKGIDHIQNELKLKDYL